MSYNPALPTARDRLRFALGDTQAPPDELLPDATYDATLTTFGGDEKQATLVLAEGLLARYALEPDSVDDEGQKASWKFRLSQWTMKANQLRGELATASAPTPLGFQTRLPQRAGEQHSEYRAGDRALDPAW